MAWSEGFHACYHHGPHIHAKAERATPQCPDVSNNKNSAQSRDPALNCHKMENHLWKTGQQTSGTERSLIWTHLHMTHLLFCWLAPALSFAFALCVSLAISRSLCQSSASVVSCSLALSLFETPRVPKAASSSRKSPQLRRVREKYCLIQLRNLPLSWGNHTKHHHWLKARNPKMCFAAPLGFGLGTPEAWVMARSEWLKCSMHFMYVARTL